MNHDYDLCLHEKQREVFEDASKYRVVVCGRRFGKSQLLLQTVILAALGFEGKVSALSPETVLVVMPTAVQCRTILFKPLCKRIEETALKYLLAKNGINKTAMTVQFMGKPTIKCVGGNDRGGDGCRGTRIYFLASDETQDLHPNVWSEVLSPAMADTTGSRALFTGTPKGTQNLLYDLAHMPSEAWRFFTYPTSANPCIPRAEIERAKATLPPRVYQQEYEADFVSFAGQIYTELRSSNIYQGTKVELPHFDLVVLGLDHGAIHPAISVLGRECRTNRWYWLEGWSPNISAIEHEPILIGRVHENLRRLCAKWSVDAIYADPSQPSEILAIRGLGSDRCYKSARAGFNKIESGINQVHSLIHQNALLFTDGLADDVPYAVDGRLAYELHQSYHYVSKKGIVTEEPADGSFSHICDSTRYALAYSGG